MCNSNKVHFGHRIIETKTCPTSLEHVTVLKETHLLKRAFMSKRCFTPFHGNHFNARIKVPQIPWLPMCL